MDNFQLSLHFSINGIGATSGLIYKENSLFIISDNSSFLYEYILDTKILSKIKLTETSQENIAKKDKLDFESISLFENKLYIYGSGSTKKRNERFTYNLETKEIKRKNIATLYQKLKDFSSISDDDLNIEGAIIDAENYYFFQRGLGDSSKNGIFIYNKKNKNIQFNSIKLPKVNTVEATFTDAILVENTVYFLAAAENTTSTYDDGEILGSFLGSFNLENKILLFIQKISDKNKFEGLTLYQKSEAEIEFLLCEDNDTEELKSDIYKLGIRL